MLLKTATAEIHGKSFKKPGSILKFIQLTWLALKTSQEIFQCCLPLLQKYTCKTEICSFSELIFERSISPTASNS